MRFIAIILSCVLLAGCEPGIVDQLPVEKPRLVVQGEPVEGQPWLAYVSHTYSLLDPASNYGQTPGGVPDATVELYDNGVLAEELTTTDSPDQIQKYVGNGMPEVGHTYTVKIEAPGYDPITATYTQPAPVVMEKVDVTFTRQELLNLNSTMPSASYGFNIDITLTDPPSDNYYQVVMLRSSGPDPANSDYAVVEFVASRRRDKYNNFIGGTITDDREFNGHRVTLPFETFTASYIVADTLQAPYVTIVLKTLSKEYYDFRSYIGQQGPSFYDPYAQPAIVKTNVQGGLGIFAGYSKSSYTFKLQKP